MIHLGKNTTSRIISKGIAAGHSNNTYRGLVSAHRRATGARNFTNCDSLLIGHHCGAHTVPYIEAKSSSAVFEHEATTSKISEDILFYCRQRGLSADDATALVVNGFVKDVLQHLPMEFAVEAQKLISISLEEVWLNVIRRPEVLAQRAFERRAARKSPVILRGSGFARAPQDDGSTWKRKRCCGLKSKKLHVEIDGTAARALRRHGYLPRVLRSLQHEG